MTFLVFDCETTGLPATNEPPNASNVGKWDNARMLSVAVVCYTSNFDEFVFAHKIIRPDDFLVNATHIHGIDQLFAVANGVPFIDVYEYLKDTFSLCTNIVGHNVGFDIDMLKAECIRYGLDHDFLENIVIYDTCQQSRAINLHCESHKLTDLHKNLFGEEFEDAHSALADCRATARLYRYLLNTQNRLYPPITPKKIILHCSEIGSMMGMTWFRKASDVIDRIHKKYCADTYVKTRKELVREEVEGYVNLSLARGDTSTEAVSRTHSTIDAGPLSDEQKVVAKALAREKIYTKNGIEREDRTAQNLTDMGNIRICNRTFYKDICTIAGTTYTLCGRIDRLLETPDEKIIVEIKNRQRRLFNKVPDYENAQVQAYLEMLNMDKAILVEDFLGEKVSHPILRDDARWVDMHRRLTKFCKATHWVLGGKYTT